MKIKCPLCGYENEESSKFCKNCNEPLLKQVYSEDNPYIKKGESKDQINKSDSDEEDKKKNRIEMVEILKGKLEKAFNDNIAVNENIDVKLQVHMGEGIVVTDQRVMIIKGGLVGGAGFFGANCKSFYFNQITSVDLRLSVVGGHIQLTVPGSVDIKGKGFLDMGMAENAVTFTTEYKDRMKYVANLIRERVKSSQNSSHTTNKTSRTNLVDQINQLVKLKKQGILSEEEFQNAKRKLLT